MSRRINNCSIPTIAKNTDICTICNVFDVKFVALSHNTKRGAALGGILNAELLKAKGFFDNL